MKGFIIMLLVFAVTLALVLTEELYVKKVSEDLLKEIDAESINNSDELKSAYNTWEEKEKILSWVINHKELEKITIDLKSALVYYEDEKDFSYRAYIAMAREKISNLPKY